MNFGWIILILACGGLFLFGQVTYGLTLSIATVILFVVAKSQMVIKFRTYAISMFAFLAIGACGAKAWDQPAVQQWIIANVFPHLPEWTRNMLGIP